MNKENIPGYHASQCCRTCKYRTERMYMIAGDTEWQEVCSKYNCDIHDYAVCDSFEAYGKSGIKGAVKMINIVRKGIWPIPDDIRNCPVCKTTANKYGLERMQGYYASQCQCSDVTQMYPTMTCERCGTIWQYLGEKEEEKK